MRPNLKILAVISLISAFLASPALAQPEGAIIRLHFQDTGERRVVMAASQRGLVFIGQDLAPFRAFGGTALPMEGRQRSYLWISDIDRDNQEEYVFGGDPSFVLDQGADPYFGITGGCRDFYLANVVGDANPEVFCLGENNMTVWNYDGQFVWEYSVTGMRLGECHAEDVDSDRFVEFGCSTNTDTWLLVDVESDAPVQEVSDNPCSSESMDSRIDEWIRETESALAGQTPLDLGGDGSASETILFNAGSLSILDAAATVTGSVELPEGALYSLAVGDLTGDGSPELFLGGTDTVYVVSPAGELLARVEANPRRMTRNERVTIASVGANGLEDSTPEAARAVVEGSMSRLQSCYDRQMGSNPFIRVGAMFHELTVDSSGRVTQITQIYSSVSNSDLEACVQGVLNGLRFSGAAEGAGSVSVRLTFDFTDG